MALLLKDRVKETTTTVGTGTLTLAGASDTFEPFSTIGNGNTTYYAIVAQGSDNWEVGIGTVGTGTLSRDTVLASSNSGAKISFPAGTKDVFVTYPAGKVVSKDDATGINSGISLADYVDFDTAAAPATAVGRLFWNDTFGTLDMGLKGGNVTLHLGQKQVTQVINKTGASLSAANYQVVKIDGAQGQRLKVVLAQANNDANSADTIGVVNETIANNQEGFVCTSGTITNLNTTGSLQGESWNDGDILYLSGTTAGRLTNIKPTAPTHTIIVGFVIYAHNNQGKIYVKVDNGYEINELHNVKINGVTNGQVLTYNNGLWENQTNGSGTVTSVAATAGTGISVSGSPITSSGTLTITNTAPDQVVSLTAGSNVTVTGTYPSFTIAATGGGGGSGTVTDVSVVSANGFSGSVATSTTTPAITLSTSISGLLKGSAGALAAASASDVPDLPQSKITNLVTDLAAKAPLASPALTGTPTAPTAAVGTDTTQLATTAFVNAEIANDAPSKTGTGASGTWGISVTGNAGTVDNGVYTTGNQTIVGTKTFSSDVILSGIAANSVLYLTASKYITGGATLSFDGSTLNVMGTVQATSFVGALTGNASTVTNGVYTTGDQTIGGTKTFSSTISGSVSGNAGTVTNGVYTTGDQTIGGTKSFSTSPIYSDTGFQYHQHTSAHIAYIKKTGAYNWYWRRNDSGLIGGANEANLMELFDNGSLSAYGDMRAPVFYDFSNTAYYLDPANTGTSMVVAGNVGIGTTSPSNRLHVSSASAPILAENSGGGSYMIDMKATTGSFNVRLGNGGDAFLLNVNNAERMRVNSSGRVLVGAGATASLGKLVVSEASSGTAVIALESQGSWNSQISATSAGNMIFNNGGTQRMSIDASGNVIASVSMYAPIFYDSANTAFYLDANNTGTSLNVAGSIVAAGNVTAYSDIRVKDNVENITDAIGKLNQIRGVTYTRTDLDDKERKYAGVIAQEIEHVLPEAVFDNGKVKGVDYNATIALLIEAVKEQQKRIDKLETLLNKGN